MPVCRCLACLRGQPGLVGGLVAEEPEVCSRDLSLSPPQAGKGERLVRLRGTRRETGEGGAEREREGESKQSHVLGGGARAEENKRREGWTGRRTSLSSSSSRPPSPARRRSERWPAGEGGVPRPPDAPPLARGSPPHRRRRASRDRGGGAGPALASVVSVRVAAAAAAAAAAEVKKKKEREKV